MYKKYEKENWLRYCVDAVKLRNKLSHKKTFLSSYENDIDRGIYCNMHEVNFLYPNFFVESNFPAAHFEILCCCDGKKVEKLLNV